MLPEMKLRPTITIVGAGNLASSLSTSLHRAGYVIEAVIGRSTASSRKRARGIAKEVGAIAFAELPGALKSNLVWFCVPDSQVASVARSFSTCIDWRGRVALHSSGVLSSDELHSLRRRGAAVASAHPLMTFVGGSRPRLANVPFAVEGDPEAIRIVRRIIKDLGGHTYRIRKQQKAAYHAWGTFVSPLFTALLATAEQVAKMAGVSPRQARRRMIPILLQTLANYASLGAPAGFSGPIVRGDAATVSRHLRKLGGNPVVEEVYRSLAKAALHYLPVKNRAQLRKVLRARQN